MDIAKIMKERLNKCTYWQVNMLKDRKQIVFASFHNESSAKLCLKALTDMYKAIREIEFSDNYYTGMEIIRVMGPNEPGTEHYDGWEDGGPEENVPDLEYPQ